MAELAANDAADDALVATVEQATDEANRTDPLLEAGEDDDEVRRPCSATNDHGGPECRYGQLENTARFESSSRTRGTRNTTQESSPQL